ncbi:MAG: hypothetical protein ACREH8_05050, partial [Opitutaceae bacterium]
PGTVRHSFPGVTLLDSIADGFDRELDRRWDVGGRLDRWVARLRMKRNDEVGSLLGRQSKKGNVSGAMGSNHSSCIKFTAASFQ